MFQRTESFGYLVNHLARLFIRALERRIAPYGLTSGQFPALLMLWERPGVTQAEMARATAVEQPTMANTLKRMERDGLIERRPDSEDGRRTLVYPTERAVAIRDAVLACATQVNAAAVDGFSDAERAQTLRLFGRMIGNLERDVGTDSGVGSA